ncbi:MAG: hypothetical protein HOK84_06775, partial [Bacteroidetes bacterium]|nr:hypothetical protein [Bacteroidota bacterium]
MNVRYFTLVLLLVFFSCQPKVDLNKYFNADVLVLDLNKTFILHPDGSVEQQIIKKITVQHPA